ncbi:MAG: hypothetical protein AB1772_08055 [Candidatus Zixiibacteriota bacterium]
MHSVIGRLRGRLLLAGLSTILTAAPAVWCDGGKLLNPSKSALDSTTTPNTVRRRCLTPDGNGRRLIEAVGEKWKLPVGAQSADFDTTIHCLVLRFDFQYETVDDPNTTGRGHMNMSRPLDTLTDEEYIARVGHLIDPPPHDSLFFDAHMRALNRYWETVSGGQIHLSWDIFPRERDSVYELPHPMSYYGKCDFADVVEGLEAYFVDCITLADTTDPEIDFSAYDAFFLFHAGSDAQNDIGFPTTCADLFSGYIKFAGEVSVDSGAHGVSTALMMPETTVQDGRATALNAVMAHEFGHQLGLIDLYNTENFFTQVGDFSLMDNNGFGTGIDFGWPAGKVFGAIPLLPDAWSRAYLGVDDVVDFRRDTADVQLVAAEMMTDPGLRIARLPITENEFYLVENRLEEVDKHTTYVLADQETSVIQGPVDSTRAFTGEYDFLMPGSGVLILHVDEEVAALDYDGDGLNNFEDNDAQWHRDERKFVRLVEADGLVHFGGNYYAGFGNSGDLFRDDRKDEFTPNTNPATVDNSGNQTHFFVEQIERLPGPSGRDDRQVRFDFEIDRQADGFPVRAGSPQLQLAPIADDVDGDGYPEIIMAADRFLSVVTAAGKNFIRTPDNCPTCPVIYDSAASSVNRGTGINPAAAYAVPVYAIAPAPITSGPVAGSVPALDDERLVAIGHPHPNPLFAPVFGIVSLYRADDANADARADLADSLRTIGWPVMLSFGDSILYALTTTNELSRWYLPNRVAATRAFGGNVLIHGSCRSGNDLVLLASDTLSGADDSSWVYYVDESPGSFSLSVDTFGLSGLYIWGPISVDMNRDGIQEIAVCTPDGSVAMISIDTTSGGSNFSMLSERRLDRFILTSPSAGDIDLDGYPELIIGGRNEVLAFNQELILKSDYPLEVDDRFPDAAIIAAPLVADIASGGRPELVFASSRGNVYAFADRLSYGFPLSSGEQRQFVSGTTPVSFHDASGGKIGWLGGDGWFYVWEADTDTITDFWPMNGADPGGSFVFDAGKLPSISPPTMAFDDSKFYNYPNPVRDGQTTIRYYLGDDANSVKLNIYDLSGRRITQLDGRGRGGTDNEVVWDCSGVTAGVYRCVIEVNYSGATESAFTDIAIIR